VHGAEAAQKENLAATNIQLKFHHIFFSREQGQG